jgi:hypothetical protein
VVWPSLALCTSIVDPAMEATLPLAPAPAGAVAAPALTVVTRTRPALSPASAAVTAPHRPRPLRLGRVGVRVGVLCMVVFVSLVVGVIYSLRSASIGARWAARLAG